MDDLDHELLGVDEDRDALGHAEVRYAKLGLDLLQRREVDLEGLRDVRRQALHAHRVDGLKDVRIAALDGGGLADQVNRHLDGDFLFEAHLVEVDVDRAKPPRVGLDLAHEHLLGAVPVDQQVDQVGAPRLPEHLLELEAIEDQRGGLGVVAIDDGGQLALAVEAAGALAQEFAGGGFELHG